MFLFLSSFHLSPSLDVFRVFWATLPFEPPPYFSPSCAASFLSPSCLRGQLPWPPITAVGRRQARNHGNRCPSLGMDVTWHMRLSVESGFPAPVLPRNPVPPTLSPWLDRKQRGLWAQGSAAAGADVQLLAIRSGVAGKGDPSPSWVRLSKGALRRRFIYETLRPRQEGDSPRAPGWKP